MSYSLQQSAPGSKSSKFVSLGASSNLLDPIRNPFGDDNGNSTQQMEEEEQRLLRQKEQQQTKRWADQKIGACLPQQQQQQEQQQQQPMKQQQQQQQQHHDSALEEQLLNLGLENDDKDDNENGDDYDDDLLLDDHDNEFMEALRERRLAELKREHETKQEQLAAGHGQYRTITQDEFLTECGGTNMNNNKNQNNNNNNSLRRREDDESSEDENDKKKKDGRAGGASSYCVIHFAHDEFPKCKIMDYHLQLLATHYLECKFLRILAPKAPFFVQKLKVQILPTVLVFNNNTGQLVHRLIGFEGLLPPPTINNNNHSDPKDTNFETWRLAKYLSDQTQCIQYKGPMEYEREELLQRKIMASASQQHRTVYRGACYDGED